jgi:hypothetical protein
MPIPLALFITAYAVCFGTLLCLLDDDDYRPL